MSPAFADDDIGKPVENATGDRIGTITAIESGTAHVEPDPGLADSIGARLGRESASGETLELDESVVRAIDAHAVRLGDVPATSESDRRADRDQRSIGTVSDESVGFGSPDVGEMRDSGRDPVEERDAIEGRNRGVEVDPTDLTDRVPEAEFRPGDGVGERTDAGVEPKPEPRRTDAEVDLEAVRDADTAGPTTEDVDHTAREDAPGMGGTATDEEETDERTGDDARSDSGDTQTDSDDRDR